MVGASVTTGRRLFDTHCHLFEHGYAGLGEARMCTPGAELAAYERLRREHGIERSFVVGYDEGEYAGNSEHIAALAGERGWLIPLRYVTDTITSDCIAAYPTVSSASALASALEAAAATDASPRLVSLNVRPAAIDALAATITALQETWFLIAHLGLPGPVADRDHAVQALSPLLSLAGLPNVSVKVSGHYAASTAPYPHPDVQPLLDVLGDSFGVDALVWGSDFSPSLSAMTFAEAVDCSLPAGLSAHERDAVLHANAARMFTHHIGDAR